MLKLFANINLSAHIKPKLLNNIHTTAILNGEPLKKKKRVDPAIVRQREERKRVRIERSIRRLEKFGRKLKPVEELEHDRTILKSFKERKREVEENKEKEFSRFRLRKEWAIHQQNVAINEWKIISNIRNEQEKALNKLKELSPQFYELAIKVDDSNLEGLKLDGPVHRLIKQNYIPPEGNYNDKTRLYNEQVFTSDVGKKLAEKKNKKK
ncbi:hypothetical protein SNEBB_001420 [Seison nebaliae]|nr:hypothetical protein SNEBB_001420 [Seison nebaliae]